MNTCEGLRNGREEIAARAYNKWVRRDGANSLGDWLDAEAEVLQLDKWKRQVIELEEQIKTEQRLAQQIQQGLLPKAVPAPPGYSLGGRSCPSQMVGGDYFDFFPTTDGCLGMAIGDASGHGIGSALMIAGTRAYLRALALTSTDLGEILTLTNCRLADDLEAGHFVTLFLAVLDPRTGCLVYAGAGHCPGYVLTHAGHKKATLYGEGPPLGIEPTSVFPVSPEISLDPGDLLFLYTDGVVEAYSTSAERLFGIERALEIVREHRLETPAGILDALFLAVSDFSQPGGQIDDATAIVIKMEHAGENRDDRQTKPAA